MHFEDDDNLIDTQRLSGKTVAPHCRKRYTVFALGEIVSMAPERNDIYSSSLEAAIQAAQERPVCFECEDVPFCQNHEDNMSEILRADVDSHEALDFLFEVFAEK